MIPASTAIRCAERLASQFAAVFPEWEDYGAPMSCPAAAEALAASLTRHHTRFEFRVSPRGVRFEIQRKPR